MAIRQPKLEELKKGSKVIIRSNPKSMMSRDIIGIVEKAPEFWTRVYVRYTDPNKGALDDNGFPIGESIVGEFMLVHLEMPSVEGALDMAKHYKRLTLEFKEMYDEEKLKVQR